MAVDLSKWTVEAYETQFSQTFNWQVARDGSSVYQSVNGGASLFCSDFDATGSTLEGKIKVLPNLFSNDNDYIGFALGYKLGDNVDTQANWYLIDWKKETQTLTDTYCDSDVEGLAGLAFSEIHGTPVEQEFWSHSSFHCNNNGTVEEISRGINYGSIGWNYNQEYEFRFEVSENHLLAYVNGELELDITGSFDISGSFCYYNLSQNGVRYSGLSRSTPAPTVAPKPPLCELLQVSKGGSEIMARAIDLESGIHALQLGSPSDDVVLNHSPFEDGVDSVDFILEIGNEPKDTSFRNSVVLVENVDGTFCSFPSIGEIIDDDCIENASCTPDSPIDFVVPSSAQGKPVLNLSSAKLLVEPQFAQIQMAASSIRYVPSWTGIQNDAFVIESETNYGDTVILSAQYFGANHSVALTLNVIGQWSDYVWDTDEGSENGRLLASKRGPHVGVEWHHEVARGPFVTSVRKRYNIPGIDNAFLDGEAGKKYGIILLVEDHNRKGNPISTKAYNTLWENEMDNFIEVNGRNPTKDEVLTVVLDEVRKDPRVVELNSRGIKPEVHNLSYNEWGEKSNEFKKQKVVELKDMARARAIKNSKSITPRAHKQALRKTSKIPIVGSFISVGLLALDLLDGRPVGEALFDHVQDMIPVWGELRGLYSLAKDSGLLEMMGIEVDAASLEMLLWKGFLKGFGLAEILDKSKIGGAQAYPDPHFRTWNRVNYDYHGECDMIYLQNSFLEVHIRTKSQGHWSSIAGVAIKIGEDIIEAQDNDKVLLNGEALSTPPDIIGGGYPFSFTPSFRRHSLKILISSREYIFVQNRYGSMRIAISAHGSRFFDSNGMTGKWDRRELMGRDGVTIFKDIAEYAREWEVDAARGDPILFLDSTGKSCLNPGPIPTPDEAMQIKAMESCAEIKEELLKKQCVFDVSMTGDVSFAQSEVYTNPFEPLEICVASVPDACELRGGSCVWRCDPAVSECLPTLCEMEEPMELFGNKVAASDDVLEGCSCAVPLALKGSTIEPISSSSQIPALVPLLAVVFLLYYLL